MSALEKKSPNKRKDIAVLLALAPPDGTTKYVVQLTEGKAAEVSYQYFSWKTALFGTYQVFHVHWPEQLVRARQPLFKRVKQWLFKLLMLRIRLSRIAVVRTLHNLHPHETGNAREEHLLAQLDAATDLKIRLNAATPMDEKQGVTILHGHYMGRYPGATVSDSELGRLLNFGLIRPYKGVERLLEVFQFMADNTLTLRVVGKPTADLRTLVETACTTDRRISSRLEFVADDVLASEIYRAELVILPYKEMHNSGAILVALSLGRPVLAPRSATNELLAQEVGPGWVNMYEGELTAEIVLSALQQIRSSARAQAPQLSGRDWDVVGEQHYNAYLQAIHRRWAR